MCMEAIAMILTRFHCEWHFDINSHGCQTPAPPPFNQDSESPRLCTTGSNALASTAARWERGQNTSAVRLYHRP